MPIRRWTTRIPASRAARRPPPRLTDLGQGSRGPARTIRRAPRPPGPVEPYAEAATSVPAAAAGRPAPRRDAAFRRPGCPGYAPCAPRSSVRRRCSRPPGAPPRRRRRARRRRERRSPGPSSHRHRRRAGLRTGAQRGHLVSSAPQERHECRPDQSRRPGNGHLHRLTSISTMTTRTGRQALERTRNPLLQGTVTTRPSVPSSAEHERNPQEEGRQSRAMRTRGC